MDLSCSHQQLSMLQLGFGFLKENKLIILQVLKPVLTGSCFFSPFFSKFLLHALVDALKPQEDGWKVWDGL